MVTGGTGKAAFIPNIYTAGKTGTTQDSRDAWFIGYAGGDIIAVWLGNDDNSPTDKALGGTFPAQIFETIASGLGGDAAKRHRREAGCSPLWIPWLHYTKNPGLWSHRYLPGPPLITRGHRVI